MNSASDAKIDLSIIMCYRNEGSEPLNTIASILETCGSSRIEILAIDDASDEEIDLSRYPQVRYMRSERRTGVLVNRDAGVAAARSENILSIDAHTRFRKDNWLEKGLAVIEKNPQSISCTTSVDIAAENFDLKQTVLPMTHGLPSYHGCSLKLFVTQKDNPRKPPGFRNIIESFWAEERYGDIYPIPCLMGSNYFFKKAWYEHLHGFQGLKTWGNAEPFLSLKSWLAGGAVRIIKDIEIGHLYRRKNPNPVPREHIIYNKIVTAVILFTPQFAGRLIDFLGDRPPVLKAKELLKADASVIETERLYFAGIKKLSETDCFKKLGIDYRVPPLNLDQAGTPEF